MGVLVLVAAGFAGGAYVGFDKGAEVTGKLHSQGTVGYALANAKYALAILQEDVSSDHRHAAQAVLQMAVVRLDGYGSNVNDFWQCSEQDLAIMKSVRAHYAEHPMADDEPWADQVRAGATFCAKP